MAVAIRSIGQISKDLGYSRSFKGYGYADTTAANAGGAAKAFAYLITYGGGIKFWLRNESNTRWIGIGMGSGAAPGTGFGLKLDESARIRLSDTLAHPWDVVLKDTLPDYASRDPRVSFLIKDSLSGEPSYSFMRLSKNSFEISTSAYNDDEVGVASLGIGADQLYIRQSRVGGDGSNREFSITHDGNNGTLQSIDYNSGLESRLSFHPDGIDIMSYGNVSIIPSKQLLIHFQDSMTISTSIGGKFKFTEWTGFGYAPYFNSGSAYLSKALMLSPEGEIITVPRDSVGGGASVGGGNQEIQFNNSGALAGSPNLRWNGSMVFGNSGNDYGWIKAYDYFGVVPMLEIKALGGHSVNIEGDAVGVNGSSFNPGGELWSNRASIGQMYFMDTLGGAAGSEFRLDHSTTTGTRFKIKPNGTGFLNDVVDFTIPYKPNVLFDFFSNTRGMMFPKNSTSTISGIASPEDGLFLYDSTKHKYVYFDGTAWTEMGGGSKMNNMPIVGDIFKLNTIPDGANRNYFYLSGSASVSVASGEMTLNGIGSVGTGNIVNVPLDQASEKWTQVARIRCNVTTGTQRIGLGTRPSNRAGINRAFSSTFDVASGADKGKIFIFTGNAGTFTQQAVSSALPSLNNGDTVELTVIRDGYIFTCRAKNIRTGDSVSVSYSYPVTSSEPVMLPTSRPAIYQLNQANQTLLSWSYTENTPVDPYLLIIGDSKTAGHNTTTNSNRFVSTLQAAHPDSVFAFSGYGDELNDAVKWLHLIKRVKPKNVVIALGSNDVRNSQTEISIAENLSRVIEACKFINANVYFLGMGENSINQSYLWQYATASVGGSNMITAYPALAGDGVHLSNDAAHATVKAAIEAKLF